MGYNANPVNAYRQTRVKTASQGQIIVMLYDEALRRIDQAHSALDDGPKSYDVVNSAVGKAQDIVTELMASLDFEQGGELAENLFSLYSFFNRQLREANLQKSKQPLEALRPLMSDLRDAWQRIASSGTPNAGESSGAQTEGGGINFAG